VPSTPRRDRRPRPTVPATRPASAASHGDDESTTREIRHRQSWSLLLAPPPQAPWLSASLASRLSRAHPPWPNRTPISAADPPAHARRVASVASARARGGLRLRASVAGASKRSSLPGRGGPPPPPPTFTRRPPWYASLAAWPAWMLRRLPPTSASVVDPSRPFCHPPNPSHPYLSAAGPASPQSGSHPPRSLFQRRRAATPTARLGWASPPRRTATPRAATRDPGYVSRLGSRAAIPRSRSPSSFRRPARLEMPAAH
jgi:hypothetical protein